MADLTQIFKQKHQIQHQHPKIPTRCHLVLLFKNFQKFSQILKKWLKMTEFLKIFKNRYHIQS